MPLSLITVALTVVSSVVDCQEGKRPHQSTFKTLGLWTETKTLRWRQLWQAISNSVLKSFCAVTQTMIERSDSNSNGNGKDNRKCLKEKTTKPKKTWSIKVVAGHGLLCGAMLPT